MLDQARLRRAVDKAFAKKSFMTLATSSRADRSHAAGVIFPAVDWVDGSGAPIRTFVSALMPENRRPRSAPRSTATIETFMSSAAPENRGSGLAVNIARFQSQQPFRRERPDSRNSRSAQKRPAWPDAMNVELS
jgi:hypothetical protein